MKIESSIEIVNDVYVVQIGVPSVSPVEQEALNQFGDPTVDVGGEFEGTLTRPSGGDPVSVSYTLPNKLYQLPSTFPVQQVFSLEDYPDDADVRAEVYRQIVIARITSARVSLLAKVPSWVGETVNTL
jgi:hypothetical protein